MQGETSVSRPRFRGIKQTLGGMAASDGAGVKLTRYIGTPDFDHLDPFLLFDVFRSDNSGDYIGGFPEHPHRGFETVTYMLAGNMRHRDNAGNEGVIRPGGVQWMTAGRGILHSEMPEQQDGLLWGTQLWVNLPRGEKMTEPEYHEFDASAVPVDERADGARVTVVAGDSGNGFFGPVKERPTDPLFFDISLPERSNVVSSVPASHNAFVFVIEGGVDIGGQAIRAGTLATLGAGDTVSVTGIGDRNRALLIAARQLNEPIARGGPFVMNTREELQQAFRDFRDGRF
ncbi:MAG: pirin family protein [Woeseia sp.]|nr:pirin family protein [Woeseia sp.]